jgi:o-succinylbenzoate---CoA ligase
MTGMTLISARGKLSGNALEAEIEFRAAQMRRSGARQSYLDVVGTIEEETVVRILAAARMGARVVLVHPRWTEAEKTAALARIQSAPAPKRGMQTGDFILFTSGTEGEPKAVELTTNGFETHAKATAKRLPTAKEDRWLLTLTPAHVGGLALILRAHFQDGTLVVPPNPLPKNLTPVVDLHRITHLSLVPTQLQAWMSEFPRPPKTLKCILLGGGACPAELEASARASGWPIRLTYGTTETSSQIATQAADSPAGSVGPALPGFEVRIDAPPGDFGRILVRSPTMFLRYLGDETATKDALVDGWYATPDVGRLDAKGNLWVAGRRDDIIVSGGENIDPAEVERVLERHPQVAEACVVGVPDAKWGQAVTAVVVARAKTVSVDDLLVYSRAKLAAFKVPRSIVFWDALPRTANGKLQRAKVRAQLVAATVPT